MSDIVALVGFNLGKSKEKKYFIPVNVVEWDMLKRLISFSKSDRDFY